MRRLLCLAIITLGAAALAFGPLLRWWVAPTVLLAPTNAYQVLTATGKAFTVTDTTSGQKLTDQVITKTTTVRGVPAESTAKTAVRDVYEYTVVGTQAAPTQPQVLAKVAQKQAVDRTTGQLSTCCGAQVNGAKVPMSGVQLNFGPDAKKTSYEFYDPTAQKAHPVTFEGAITITEVPELAGVVLYHYRGVLSDAPVGGLEVPGVVVGRTEPTFPVVSVYSVTRDVYVEPRSGVVVRLVEQVRHALRAPDQDVDLVATFDGSMTWTGETVAQQAKYAAAKNAATHRWTTTYPAVLIGAGVLVVTLGMVLFWRTEFEPRPLVRRHKAEAWV